MSDLPAPPSELTSRVDLARKLAEIAAKVTLPLFRQHGETIDKAGPGDFDPVTKADRDAEAAMRDYLARAAPDDGINGEEFGVTEGTSGWTWYLDPVDGTRAFIAGLPSWTTLIGCVRGDEPIIGVIDQPYLDERYVGWTDDAILETRGRVETLQVGRESRLTGAILSTTDPFILTPSERGAFEHLRQTAKLTRYGLDAYAYARLAGGDINLVTETGLQPHDVAALIPVVRGAGGVACDWEGQPARLGPQLACASSQDILDQALISLRRSAGRKGRIGLD